MPKKAGSSPDIPAMRKKLNTMRPRAASNPSKEAIRQLVDAIDQKRAEGFTMADIFAVLKDDLGIKESSFKTYYRAVKSEKSQENDNG